MSLEHLATYLNDHLAGSVTALELLRSLESANKGTPLEDFAQGLRAEIEEDREELQWLMKRLGVSASATRQAVAWVSEKAMELKLKVDDAASSGLRLLESLEAVSLGVEGKRSLWKALQAAATANILLNGPDYQRLLDRAQEQRNRIESKRIEAACTAFAPSAPK